MKYSIEDTTLTNIANAIRSKVGDTRPVYAEYAINKSGSSTGFDYTHGAYTNSYTSTTTINGASYLKVKMAYAARNISSYAFYVNDIKYSTESYTPSAPELVEFTVNGDSVTFRVELIDSSSITQTGWYAEIRGYDENDNIVLVATEETEPNNLTPIQMAEVINNMPEKIPDSAFVISGNCTHRFAYNGWDWFIELYGNKITTQSITDATFMFQSSSIESIPFDINCSNDSYYDYGYMFRYCTNLKEIGTIRNLYPYIMQYLFSSCKNLRQLPIFENLNMSKIYDYEYSNIGDLFSECYSLRNIPEELLNVIYQTKTTSPSYIQFYYEFFSCFSLDEVKGLNPQTGNLTRNCFDGTFNDCNRLKNITFAKQDDGTPYTVSWKNQIIVLSYNVGYAAYNGNILNYNSGITADKEVTDATSYQALKNDPDWFTTKVEYSRYNHDSAVATINSLPDTSAYLATAGGTNTIKFEGAAGSATDGGAISSLTEEEIAVATAKGWTVTLV